MYSNVFLTSHLQFRLTPGRDLLLVCLEPSTVNFDLVITSSSSLLGKCSLLCVCSPGGFTVHNNYNLHVLFHVLNLLPDGAPYSNMFCYNERWCIIAGYVSMVHEQILSCSVTQWFHSAKGIRRYPASQCDQCDRKRRNIFE